MLTPEQRREREQAKLRALFPDAVPWYGVRSGPWLAAPSGAKRLLQAPTAQDLAEQLTAHYRRYLTPQTPRPGRQPNPRPGGAGAVARRAALRPPTSRATVPSRTLAGPTRPEAATRPAVVSRTPVPSRPAVRRPTPSYPAASRPPGRRDVRHPAPKNGWLRRGLIRLGLMAETA